MISGATLGNVQESNKLDPKIPQVQSVVGYETSFQAEIFAKNIKAACEAKNGAGTPCKVGVMPGAAKFPTDALQFQVDQVEPARATRTSRSPSPRTAATRGRVGTSR